MKFRLKKNNKFNVTLLYWPVVGILLLLIAGFGSLYSRNESMINSSAITLSDGWKDEAGNEVTLPTKLNFENQHYEVSKTIDTYGKAPQYLLFSVKYQNTYFYLNDVEIGSAICKPADSSKTLGKKFILIRLPDNIRGGVLRIESKGLLNEDSQYEIKAPQIGESASLIYEVMVKEALLLIINIVIICFGIFLLIYGIQALRAMSRLKAGLTYHVSFLYIGVFAILFSFYSFAIMDTTYLFVFDTYVIYLMEFLLLALIPIPLLQLVMKSCGEPWKKLLGINCVILSINFIVQILLHFVFKFELKDTVWLTHILMVIATFLLVPSLIPTNFKDRDKWWLPLSFIPVLAGALFDIIRYYIPDSYQKAYGFQGGVLFFMLIQTAYLVRQNLITCQSSLKSNLYRQMAYTDALTGFSNRAAFETTINEIQEKLDSFSSIWCISADINNLKTVNDNLGHSVGDDLIKEAAELLRNAIGEEEKIYRTGGDEFICFLFNQSKSKVDTIYRRIEEAQVLHQLKHDYHLSIAIGIDRFNFLEGDTIAKLVSRCDVLMYQDKHSKKEERNT